MQQLIGGAILAWIKDRFASVCVQQARTVLHAYASVECLLNASNSSMYVSVTS